MSNYTQWRTAADKGEVRRVTWVCGDQHILVEEIVDTIRTQLGVSDLDYVSLRAGTTPDAEIWAAANQYAITPGARRLILVRQAEKISYWAGLENWFAGFRHLPGVHLLFVSGEPDFAYVRKNILTPYLELIKNKGRIVRCAMPNEADALAWVKRQATLDDEMARYLLQRVGGNLRTAAGVCAKLRVFDGQAGPNTIDALCGEAPADSFTDALLAGKKPQALLAAQTLSPPQYGFTLAALDSRLDLLAALWRATRAGLSMREIRDVPVFLARRYLPLARHYDPQRCVYARRVLAVVDEAHKNGARVGLIEALVALW